MWKKQKQTKKKKKSTCSFKDQFDYISTDYYLIYRNKSTLKILSTLQNKQLYKYAAQFAIRTLMYLNFILFHVSLIFSDAKWVYSSMPLIFSDSKG